MNSSTSLLIRPSITTLFLVESCKATSNGFRVSPLIRHLVLDMGPDDKPPPYAPGTYVGPPAPGGYAPPPPRTYQGGAFIPPTDGQYHHQAPYPPHPGAYPPAGPPPPGMARCLKPLNQPSRPQISPPGFKSTL